MPIALDQFATTRLIGETPDIFLRALHDGGVDREIDRPLSGVGEAIAQTLFDGRVPHQNVCVPFRFDKFDQPAALALDQFLLEAAHARGVQAPVRFESGLDQHVNIDARNSGDEARQLGGGIIASELNVTSFERVVDELDARGFVGGLERKYELGERRLSVMAPPTNLAAKYRSQAIQTAPGPQLLVMLYDRLAGAPMEWDTITGEIVRRAQRHGLGVPLNSAILALLQGLDSSRPEVER